MQNIRLLDELRYELVFVINLIVRVRNVVTGINER